MHGKKSLYSSNYSYEDLKSLARRIKKHLKHNLEVYCYFNNDANGFACQNAKSLQKLCGEN